MAQGFRVVTERQIASVAVGLLVYIIARELLEGYISSPWYVRVWNKVQGTIKEYGQVIAFFVLFVAIIVRFAYWGNYPSIVSASVFWTLATTYGVLFIITASNRFTRLGWIIMRIGGSLNMIVVLANGGFMPVVGGESSKGLWVVATESHRLLFLADRFWGLSLGDLVLMGGLAVVVVAVITNSIIRRLDAKYKVGRVLG